MEILVIDNHSDDESIGWIRARYQHHPSIRILEIPRNDGYGKSNTAAAQVARGEYLFILNPDNRLETNTLEQMLSLMKNDASIGVIAPVLRYPQGGIRPSARRFPAVGDLLLKRFFPSMWYAKYQQFLSSMTGDFVDVDWLVGTCLLLPRSLFLSLGGFDPRFFLFFEDVDLCRRIHQAGKRVVYARSFFAFDQPERLSGHSVFSVLLKKTTRIHFVSAVRYFWKWR
jgi:GT2 family glycosyltransferase